MKKLLIIPLLCAALLLASCGAGASNPHSLDVKSGESKLEETGSLQTAEAGSKPYGAGSATPTEPAEPQGYEGLLSSLSERADAYLSFVSSDVSEYPLVRLYYSYCDSSGEPITLYAPLAGIVERINGGAEIERTVRQIQQLEGNQGLSIDIVADKSASMSGSIGEMQAIMSEFVESMDFASGDKAEIIAFDTYIMYMCTYTQDVSLLQNGIYNMSTYGNTALYDALITGINNAANQAGARCVIGFTDGEDNESYYSPQDVINTAVQKEVPVYIIGTGGADYSVLNSICASTGGTYWNIYSISDMQDIMEQIYSAQKSMYCIEYESDPAADPYAERTVQCVLTERGGAGKTDICTFIPSQALAEQTHSSRYEVIKADITWTEANDLCIARGGHLATITSQAEQDMLTQMAADAGIRFVWIGGYTSVRWDVAYGHWVTGEPFDYTAWFPGEPSRNDQDGTPEFYLMLWYVNDEWSWNDQRNDPINDTGLAYFPGNVGYICEFED